MPSFALRTTFYALIVTFSAAGLSLGITDAWNNVDINWEGSSQTALAGGIILVPVFLTSNVLLLFNNRPYSTKPMARAGFHLYANVFMCVLSLISAILLITHLGANCDFSEYSDGLVPTWCALRISPSLLGWFSCFLSGALAILFWREGGLQSNVAERADLHRKVETTV